MTDQEITELVSDILREKVPDAGFLGAEAFSSLDFDGDPIIKIVARYQRRPDTTPDPLLNASHLLRSALISRGEDRFILLKNDVVGEQQTESDID
jgi:hypothetical protein